MADEDVAVLVARLEVELSGLTKGMEKAQAITNESLKAIESRLAQSEQTMSRSFSGLRNLTSKLFTGAALIGVERFVEHIGSVADELVKMSRVTGFSTTDLQTFGIAAARVGVTQEELTTSLVRFSRSLGQAREEGGPLAKTLTDLGVNLKGPVKEAILQYADGLARLGNQEERNFANTRVMGRNTQALTAFYQQGGVAIRQVTDALGDSNKVMKEDTLKSIEELIIKWKEFKLQFTSLGGNALGELAPTLGKILDDLQSPGFQEAIKNFAVMFERVAAAVAAIGPHIPALAAAVGTARLLAGTIGSGPAALVGGLVAAGTAVEIARSKQARELTVKELHEQLDLEKQIKAEEAKVTPVSGNFDKLRQLRARLDTLVGKVPETVEVTPRQGVGGEAPHILSPLEEQSAREVSRTALEAKKALADLVKASAAANTELAAGTLAIFALTRAQIAIDAEQDKRVVQADTDAKLGALKAENFAEGDFEKAKANIRAAGAAAINKIDLEASDKRLKNARAEVEARFKLQEELVKASDDTAKAINSATESILQGTIAYYDEARRASAQNQADEERAIRTQLAHEQEVLDLKRKGIEESKTIAPAEKPALIADISAERVSNEAVAQQKLTALVTSGAAERAQIDNQQLQDTFTRNQKLEDSQREVITSEQELNTERSQASKDYFELQRQIIAQNTSLDKVRIQETLTNELNSIAQRESAYKAFLQNIIASDTASATERSAAIDALATSSDKFQKDRVDANEEANNKLLTSDNKAALERTKLNEQETHARERQVQILDQFRAGLEDIGVSALKGAKGFGDAIKQMLIQLAEMTLRLAVLRPIIEHLFGREGSTDTGIIGKALGSLNIAGLFGFREGGISGPQGPIQTPRLFGFSQGGVSGPSGPIDIPRLPRFAGGGTANSASIFAESGPEAAVPLSGGRYIPVDLRFPPMPQLSKQPGVVQQSFSIDARGAQMGVAEQIQAALVKAAPIIAGSAYNRVRSNMPNLMQETQKRSF